MLVGPAMRRLAAASALLCACTAGPGRDSGAGGKADEAVANLPAAVREAAEANLRRVSREVDPHHLSVYGYDGTVEEQFLQAVATEYLAEPDQLEARMRALASMVFFAMPEVEPPQGGRLTPFHGLDEEQFAALMEIQDFAFNALVAENGGELIGVRPFSVCETKFQIETFVRPREAHGTFAAYRTKYRAFAADCTQADLAEWYNYRGLGGLRPSWLESNIEERVLRRMVKECDDPSDDWREACARWDEDRLAYRDAVNRQLSTRFFYYAPDDEARLYDTKEEIVLLEDRNGDGVGEMLAAGDVELESGERGELLIEAQGQFGGALKFKKGTSVRSIPPRDVPAVESVDERFSPALLAEPDLGLVGSFGDDAGCADDPVDPEACALAKRFWILIDRHEDFYQTFTGFQPERSSLSSQPSPLVACSITLAAANEWSAAGTPTGGRAGFIYLMRIPFKQILAGSRKSVGTLSPGPEISALQDVAAGAPLDMSRVWLDIASLSNNLFASEHEISKYGNVPAEQIEGILVVRRPAAVD